MTMTNVKPFVEIRSWAVTIPDRYRAPEARGWPTIAGVVATSGHPSEGENMRSSAVITSDGREVITASGSRYRLVGPPRSGWLESMRESGAKGDPDRPLRDWER